MISDLNQFYDTQSEPNNSCFLALRSIILNLDDQIEEAWKYKLPFFLYKGKMFCYLWQDKITKEPYIGVVKGLEINHSALVQGNRSKIKILPINANKDIEIDDVKTILGEAMKLY